MQSSLLLSALILLGSPCLTGLAEAQSLTEAERQTERSLVDSLIRGLSERVCAVSGFERCESVAVEVWTRRELRGWMEESLKRAFPQDEWSKLGQCLSLLGLNATGEDLQEALVELLVTQAGAGYSPELKSYISLPDVPESMKSPSMREMVIAHELTHAFQDQAIDMVAMEREDLASLDRSFAHRAVLEGMASVVMYAVAHDLPLGDLPDVSAFMRKRFRGSFQDLTQVGPGTPPQILIQFLLEPYVEGSAFVQFLQQQRPELPLASTLGQLPSSGEQILHPDKYLSGDLPTPIEFPGLRDLIPAAWTEFHRNDLGEQDLRLLFTTRGWTPDEAFRAAAGWDGFSYVGFSDREGSLGLVGISVWDTPEDAVEFSALFEGVLLELHGEDGYGLAVAGDRVAFSVGFDGALPKALLKASAGGSNPSGPGSLPFGCDVEVRSPGVRCSESPHSPADMMWVGSHLKAAGF
jgi:hypothetical protein